MKVIELRRTVTDSNDRDAEALRAELRRRGIFLLNLMSAPGSGKTTLLSRTIRDLAGRMTIEQIAGLMLYSRHQAVTVPQ